MNKIDFDKIKPDFDNGDFKWYVDIYFNDYIENKQAENLPKLNGFGCFIVKDGKDIEDYVLIDNKQNTIAAYPYSTGFEQMKAKINIIKITKYFDDYEKSNI